MDNPNLIVTCVVGDGEAETGPTATLVYPGTAYWTLLTSAVRGMESSTSTLPNQEPCSPYCT